MESIGRNSTDYWQRSYPAQRGLRNRFGIRVENGCCWALIQIGDGEAITFGEPQAIPVNLAILPIYLSMIVDDHLMDYPSSDLGEVLAGKRFSSLGLSA